MKNGELAQVLSVLLLIFVIVVSKYLWLFDYVKLAAQNNSVDRINTAILGLVLAVMTWTIVFASWYLLRYLKWSGGVRISANYKERPTLPMLSKILQEIDSIKSFLKDNVQGGGGMESFPAFDDAERKRISRAIENNISNLLSQELMTVVEKNYSQSKTDADLLSVFSQTDYTIERNRVQIDNLERSSSVNLVIGVITTIIAILVLIYSVYWATSTSSSVLSLAQHYIPRISTIVFIEVFSFFFLRMYKSNLEDIKYYQNELTNIELKILAFKCAVLIPSPSEVVGETIKTLASTERNHKLKKWETTVALELKKSQDNFDGQLLDKFMKILRMTGKNNE